MSFNKCARKSIVTTEVELSPVKMKIDFNIDVVTEFRESQIESTSAADGVSFNYSSCHDLQNNSFSDPNFDGNQKTPGWSCCHCSFFNSLLHSYCEICENKREYRREDEPGDYTFQSGHKAISSKRETYMCDPKTTYEI